MRMRLAAQRALVRYAHPFHLAEWTRREDDAMPTSQGMSDKDKLSDIEILNRALFFENRGVWAYRFAADKLSASEVGRVVLALAAQNRVDHEKHQDLIGNAVIGLGGTPLKMAN